MRISELRTPLRLSEAMQRIEREKEEARLRAAQIKAAGERLYNSVLAGIDIPEVAVDAKPGFASISRAGHKTVMLLGMGEVTLQTSGLEPFVTTSQEEAMLELYRRLWGHSAG